MSDVCPITVEELESAWRSGKFEDNPAPWDGGIWNDPANKFTALASRSDDAVEFVIGLRPEFAVDPKDPPTWRAELTQDGLRIFPDPEYDETQA